VTAGGSLRFAEEPLAIVLGVVRGGSRNRNCFDGNGAIYLWIARAKHSAHGATSKLGGDLIPSLKCCIVSIAQITQGGSEGEMRADY